ncbi:DUF6701 domain-containing protein [Massilia aerilata]|uniref:DUF6701 domain-containing protein n=1 Tax=Massilia aerilata TaxID=453817 RepID=A0ABW0RUZ7_9BURK
MWRRCLPRISLRCLHWGLSLLAALNAGTVLAATYNFGGGNVAGCPLSSGTYTCNSFPLGSNNDKMSIADGFKVVVKESVSFDFNQSLTMSGTATLSVTGNLSIADISPNNLSINGGNLVSTGAFTIGNQAQTIAANISAFSMTLGSGSRTSITGNVTASNSISIGSHATIKGAVSGSTINTSSPVSITGDITATSSFTLASGSTVTGNIVAPTVSLLPSDSSVTGNITARTSLRLGSSVSVTGDVSTGNLILDSSNAIVTGNATVDTATLNWAGRVTKTIYCTGGTTNGKCDCVTNNSGFDVNTVNGPHCSPPAPALDHFLIVHDGSASACTPEPVTVRACANAACTSYFTGGVNVTLQPGGGSFAIGSTGVSTNATVSQQSVGSAAVRASASSIAAAAPSQCINTSNGAGAGTGSVQCGMNFDGKVGLSLSIPDQYAANNTKLLLTAAVADPSGTQCKPAFPGANQPIQFSCSYSNPNSGSLPVMVSANSDGSSLAALNASTTGAQLCDGSARTFSVAFPNVSTLAGSAATLIMNYADVGKLTLKAATTVNGVIPNTTADVVVAPASYAITTFPATTTAAIPFNVVATARNSLGNPTPNFGKENANPAIQPETLSFALGALGTVSCSLTPGVLGSLGIVDRSVAAGAVTGKLSYTEAGAINVQVQQASIYYLGGSVPRPATVQTSAAAGCGAIRSVPAWFLVHEGRVGSGLANFYYAGEPIDVVVTAKNAAGNTTLLYDKNYGYSNPVLFTAFDAAGATAIPAATGSLSGTGASAAAPLTAGAFTLGTAELKKTTAPPLAFSFASAPRAPMKVRLRATEAASGGVSSANAAAYGVTAEDSFEARSGRVSFGSSFGSAAGDLALPVTLQYWTGASWIRNVDDSEALHPLPTTAFAIQAGTLPAKPGIVATGLKDGGLLLTKGQGSLTLRAAGGAGTALVAINLGNTAADSSCLAGSRPVTGGANMPYLRGPNGICTGTAAAAADPAARATFGVFAPEARRLIHTREVFN